MNTRKNFIKKTTVAALAGMALTANPLIAKALVLIPGGAVALPVGTSNPPRWEIDGVLVSNLSTPFALTSGGVVRLRGTVRHWAVRNTITNRLTFYYQVLADPGYPGRVTDVRVQNYATAAAPFFTDVDWRNDRGGIRRPIAAQRSGDGRIDRKSVV